mmetsp:Transcript_64445/g.145420  ORF Transcript_64445/g.145420 Transcript_64445/m.145420 type:complete len:232 (-) Transcript_64445:8-703(-)
MTDRHSQKSASLTLDGALQVLVVSPELHHRLELDDVGLVAVLHGVLLEALAVSVLQGLGHLCVIFCPCFAVVCTHLHLAQVAHEVPGPRTRRAFPSAGLGLSRHRGKALRGNRLGLALGLGLPYRLHDWHCGATGRGSRRRLLALSLCLGLGGRSTGWPASCWPLGSRSHLLVRLGGLDGLLGRRLAQRRGVDVLRGGSLADGGRLAGHGCAARGEDQQADLVRDASAGVA